MGSDNTPTIKYLITQGMGYCCLWAFFSRYRQTSQIALRLGVHRVSVARYKARFRRGEFCCEGGERCMKETLLRRKKALAQFRDPKA